MDLISELKKNGYKTIAYIDEVGRGCLFGDVVACALVIDENSPIEGVKDSKKLSMKKREQLYIQILEKSQGYGIGRMDAKTIDNVNIKQATRMAMKMAIDNIADKDGNKIVPDYILIDAEEIDTHIPQKGIIDGDNLIYGISAASIVAKVYRDTLCLALEEEYPGYKISKNKGYGTKEHIEGLLELGATSNHRSTFVKKILEGKK